MANSVYDFDSYRPYLLQRLGGEGRRTGLRLQAAKAMGCHTTYISQVLKAKAELSLEQGALLNEFLNHTSEEAHFFLLLIQKERAGSPSLRSYFQKQLDEIQRRRLVLSERIKDAEGLSTEDESQFYSSWLYGAIHVLTSIPELQTLDALTSALRLPRQTVSDALEFLQRIGMIVNREGRYLMGPAHVHLRSDSKNIAKHHSNWRIKTVSSLDNPLPEDLHYSAAVTLSKRDAQRVRQKILKCLEENIAVIKDSPSEAAYVYCFDFFEL